MTRKIKSVSTKSQTTDAPFDASQLSVRTYSGRILPDDVVALRHAVYGVETGYLADTELVGENDAAGLHVCLYLGKGEDAPLIAATHIVEAEACDFGRHSGLPHETLIQGCYSSRSIVAPEYRQLGLFSLLLYLAQRECRLRGRKYIYAFMIPGDPPARRILRYDFMEGVAPRYVKGRDGASYDVVAVYQEIGYGMHRAFTTMSDDVKRFVHQSGLLADEIERTVEARIQRFYKNPWFERLYAGTLTREQYIATIANMHQFVRWTTRLLGQVVGMTSHQKLRRHYIDHLQGEIDHDVLLERDLAHLGADVDYVVNHMVPIPEIQEFMAAQESSAAFRRDPVLFLAVPFAIEGLSGHLPQEFGPALFNCIEGWGVENPRKAVSFLTSHVHTDGGDDGHWEHSRKMIRELVQSEGQVQAFLNSVHLVMNGMERAYTAYAAMPAFSRTAASGRTKKTSTSAA